MTKQDDKAFDLAAARAVVLIDQDVGDDYESVVEWQRELREAVQVLVAHRADRVKAD